MKGGHRILYGDLINKPLFLNLENDRIPIKNPFRLLVLDDGPLLRASMII